LAVFCLARAVASDDFTTTDPAAQVPVANWAGDNVFVSLPSPSVPGSSSVDLVGSVNGSFFPNLAPSATLNAVDLDGSEGTGFSPSGDLQSRSSLPLGNYVVSFLLAGNLRNNLPQTTTISIGSQSFSLTLPATQAYTPFSFTFLGASGPLTFLESGPATQQGSLLADVVVSTVPEPSTWAMMLLGFAGLGFAFRQSRRKVSMV
jgi:hypothetical protein